MRARTQNRMTCVSVFRAGLWSVLALTGGLLLAACGHDETSNSTKPVAGWADLPYLGLGFRTPSIEIATQLSKETEATDELYLKCMRDRGYPKAHIETNSADTVANTVLRPASVKVAREQGFGMTSLRQRGRQETLADLERMKSQAAQQQQPQTESPAQMQAGVEASRECRNEAITAPVKGTNEIIDLYTSEVLNDREIQQALTDWRTCMAEARYAVHSVGDLANQLSLSHQPHAAAYISEMSDADRDSYDAEFLARETGAAVAVADCDQSEIAPVLSRWKSLEEKWMDQHADTVRNAPVFGKYLLAASLDL